MRYSAVTEHVSCLSLFRKCCTEIGPMLVASIFVIIWAFAEICRCSRRARGSSEFCNNTD